MTWEDVSARLKRAMTCTDFQTRQRIVQALVNSVTLYPHRAVVSGVLPLNGNIPNDTRLLRSPFPNRVGGTGRPLPLPGLTTQGGLTPPDMRGRIRRFVGEHAVGGSTA